MLIYVDKIIISGSSSTSIQALNNKLGVTFALKKYKELEYLQRIEVKHSAIGALLLTQAKYIKDLLVKAVTLREFLQSWLLSTNFLSLGQITWTTHLLMGPLLGHFSMLQSLGLKLGSQSIRHVNFCHSPLILIGQL